MIYNKVAAVGTSGSKHMKVCGKEMAIRADVVILITANILLKATKGKIVHICSLKHLLI